MHSGGDGWPTFFLLFTLLRDDGDDVDVDESAPLPPPATPSPSSSTTCLAFARLSLLKSETEAKHLKRYIIDGQFQCLLG